MAKFLSRSEGGKTRLIYVRTHDELEVAQKAERYRKFRQARAELMKLATTTSQLADTLHKVLAEAYPPASKTAATRVRRRKRNSVRAR